MVGGTSNRANLVVNNHICLRIVNVDLSQILEFLKKTRNSSGDEIANVNFLYDEIVHADKNTIDSCI